MIAAVQFDLASLLTSEGCRPPRSGRGKWDCGRCGGRACLSVDLERGRFHCFHEGCDFSGGAVKLARERGLASPLSRSERQRLQRDWKRADRAARALYERARARRFELLEELRGLGRVELQAHEAGMDHPATWGALALVYAEWSGLVAELAILENCGAADLFRFLSADNATRGRVIAGVLERGRLYNSGATFVEF